MSVYIAREGKTEGPFEREEVKKLLSSGQLSFDDLAWEEGQPADWAPLHRLLGLPALPPGKEAKPPRVQQDRIAPEAERVATPAPVAAPAPPSSNVTPDGPVGVGGWLRFFGYALVALTPLFNFAVISDIAPALSQPNPSIPQLQPAMIFLVLAIVILTVYSIVVGFLLLRAHPKSKTFVLRYLALSFVGVLAMNWTFIVMTLKLPSELRSGIVEGAAQDVLKAGAFSLFWFLYFRRSKRVRNTFPSQV